MSFKKIAFSLICFLCLTTISQATLKITLTPEFGVMGGTTEYEMDIQINVLDTSAIIPVSARWRLTSLLEYPLDVTVGGISGIFHSDYDPTLWTVELKYLTNLNNPGSKMLDSDWEELSSSYPYTQFSYTESDAEMNMTILDAELRFRLIQKKNMDISVIAGGRYQKIYQDIIGIDGWQRHLDSATNTYDPAFYFKAFQNTVVGTYEVKFKQFKIGFQSDNYLSENFQTQLRLAFMPVFYNDLDDHVLRKKESTSKGDGKGYLAELNLRYNFDHKNLAFLQLSTSYNHFTADGGQTQYWYGDDPGTPEDDTGDSFSGLPHTIRSTQYMINLQLGIEF